MKMKAIVVHAPGDVRLVEYDKPVPGPRDVVSRVVFSGICGTDLGILSGKISFVKDGRVRFPARIGHEWSGVVDSVGAEVTEFKPGDRVVSDTAVSCGVCENCLSGKHWKCRFGRPLGTINAYEYGSFAEYILIPERHMYHLDDRVSFEQGALIEPATIAVSGIQSAHVGAGDAVLVTGTGAIGLISAALAKIYLAGKVFIAGRKQWKLDIGLGLGADAAIDLTKENMADAINRETSGKGVTKIIETSGAGEMFDQALDCAGQGCEIALIGFYEDRLSPDFVLDRVVLKNLVIRGATGSRSVRMIMNMMADGRFDLSTLVTHKFSIGEGVRAFMTAGELSATKIKMLIRMTE